MNLNYPEILKDALYREKMPEILNKLGEIRKVTHLETKGGALYCESYITENADKNVIILHGFTEFCAKYREMIWYLLHLNCNVFTYDQRGHGFSHRQVDDLRLVHIDSFSTYVSDLDEVINKLVKPLGNGLPIYIFSHSMGGAVASLYMMEHPNDIKKAALCAPMISPQTMNVPRPLVLMMTRHHGKKFGWDKRFAYAGDFDPAVDIRNTLDESKARFEATMKLRIATKEYQSSAATNGWMWEAVTVQDKILKAKKLKKINTQVLILSAQRDTVVKNKYQFRFAKKLKNSKVITVPCAKHNIFFSSDNTLSGFYKLLFDFFS